MRAIHKVRTQASRRHRRHLRVRRKVGGSAERPRLVVFRSSKHIDRKSTRLNSSHGYISYAVFCLKKKLVPNEFSSVFTRALGHLWLYLPLPVIAVSIALFMLSSLATPEKAILDVTLTPGDAALLI